jgi:hypothetical protein
LATKKNEISHTNGDLSLHGYAFAIYGTAAPSELPKWLRASNARRTRRRWTGRSVAHCGDGDPELPKLDLTLKL